MRVKRADPRTGRALTARRACVLIAAVCAGGALAVPSLASVRPATAGTGGAPGLAVAGQPAGIAADESSRTMWVVERDAGQPGDIVSEITEAGDAISQFSVTSGVTAIAVDPLTGLVWTIGNSSDGSTHTVTYINEFGNSVNTVAIPSATDLTGLAVDSLQQVVFVLDRAGDVYEIDEHHPGQAPSLEVTGSLTAAAGIAVDSGTSTIWVLDSSDNQVVAYDIRTGDPSGNPATVGEDPGQIAVDPARGIVWVGAADGTISVFSESSPGTVHTLTLASVPASIDLDPTDDRAWVGTRSGAIYEVSGATSPPSVTGTLTLSSEVDGVAADSGTGQLWATENITSQGTSGNVIPFLPSAPEITSPGSAWFASNNAAQRSFQVAASGFPPVSYALSDGPSWLAIGSVSGVLTAGLTARSKPGAATFTITASNGTGSAAQQSFTAHVGSDPVVTTTSATFAYGVKNSVQLEATGAPVPITFQGSGLPAGFTLSRSGSLAGTPPKGAKSPVRFDLITANAITRAYGKPVTSGFELKFAAGKAPKITSPAKATFKHGKKASFTIQTTGFPVPALSKSGNLPKGLKIKINTGSAVISGTPPASDKGKTYKIKITASNGIGRKATQTLTITIT
jgi:sugar lactone lactonase YvrE